MASGELLCRTRCDEHPVLDDSDFIGQRDGFVHIVCGQDDGTALRTQQPDCVPHLLLAFDVQPAGRLVEKQHLWVVRDRERHVDAAAHTTGKCSDFAVQVFSEAELLDEFALATLPVGFRPARHRQAHAYLLDG